MNEHEGPLERRPRGMDDLEGKAWQKPVREPMMDARPMGLPQAAPAQAQPQADAGQAADDQGANGGGQGNGDA